MKDKLIEKRSKSKFILEIRHKPILEMFDKKGEIISYLHPKIKNEFKHWRVKNQEIAFTDSLETPSDLAFIEIKRLGISFESMRSLVKFKNYLNSYIYPSFDKYYKNINEIDRIGFRLISVLSKNNEENFEEIKENILEKFFKVLPVKLDVKDLRVTFNIDNGYYLIGPISNENEEPWVVEHFKDTVLEKNGYGIDVDVYMKNVDVGNKDKLELSIVSLMDLARGIEEQIAKHLDII